VTRWALVALAACGGASTPATEAPTNRDSTSGGGGPRQEIALYVRAHAVACPPQQHVVTMFLDNREVAVVPVECPLALEFDANTWVQGPTLLIESGAHTLRAVDVAGEKRQEKELAVTIPAPDMRTLSVIVHKNGPLMFLTDSDRP